MPDFLKKILEPLNNAISKTTLTQKLIAGGVLIGAVAIIVLIFVFSSSSSGVPLFTRQLDVKDFDRITTRLSELDINFTTRGKNNIYVSNQDTKNKAIMQLAEEGSMPSGKYSFLDIIESRNITSTKFENNIKLRAALASNLEALLESSELIEDARVSFTMPEQTVFVSERSPVKVAVMLTPVWGVDFFEHKKAIKGIQTLVVNSIDRAEEENVVITDNYGTMLNDFKNESEEIATQIAKENLKIREQEIAKYANKINRAIKNLLPDDRYSVLVDVNMNFDQEKENRTEILPVILKEDDKSTPYDDGERVYSISISKKTTSEKFTGPNWIPEGPPGFDENIPPAYQGALEQITEYLRNEEIVNETFGESKKEIKKDPWEITKITASVVVDGTWEIVYDDKGNPVLNPDGTRKREYIPVGENVLKNIKIFVEQGIGNSIERGDKVEVREMQKDRAEQFKKEDEVWKRKQQTTYGLIAALIALVLLIVGVIIYRIVAKELERRRRLREEELARQHQLAREMALKNAEDEGVEVEMSVEDKARLEMQETAVNLAREHPEDVAQLIRTWLTDE